MNAPLCDKEAEEAVISSAMLSDLAWETARSLLSPADFFLGQHQDIWTSMMRLDDAGMKFDAVTVLADLRAHKREMEIGSIARLVDSTPAVAHVEDHARIVASLSRQRSILSAGRRIQAEALVRVDDVEALARKSEAILTAALETGSSSETPADLGETAAQVITSSRERKRQGGMIGVESGLKTVDYHICGWVPDLYVIAARPGMGKSAFAFQELKGIARKTRKLSVFITLEMPKEDVAARALSEESGVSLRAIRSGNLSEKDYEALTAAAIELRNIPVSIKHAPGATLSVVRSAIRQALAEQRKRFGNDLELGAVCVDYLQIMGHEGKSTNREQEVSALSRGLKALSGEMKCPVLALSQLNRTVETRNVKDKRPQMSDLRESGAIEQDADTIMFLYRDDYYFEDSKDKGLAEVIIGKQRNGQPGTVKLRFTGSCVRFRDLPDARYDYLDDFTQSLPDPHWQDEKRP